MMANQAEVEPASVTKMATLVFLDFEATGLLGPAQRPRITELCLLAVHREDLSTETGFPRVLNKLTLCLNPKKPIQMMSSQITGLYNDNLERQKDFSEATAALLDGFLVHLEQPVCLIAHYGNGYDFPLLQAELKRVGCVLNKDIYCSDSLDVFRSLDCLDMVKNSAPLKSLTDTTSIPVQFLSDYKTPEKAKTEVLPAVKRKSPEPLQTNQPSTKREKTCTTIGNVKRVLNFEDSHKNKVPDAIETTVLRSEIKETVKTDTNAATGSRPIQTHNDSFKNELLEEFEFSSIDDDELIAAAEMAEKGLLKIGDVKSMGDDCLKKESSSTMHCVASGNQSSHRDKNMNESSYVMSSSGYSVRSELEKNSKCDNVTVGCMVGNTCNTRNEIKTDTKNPSVIANMPDKSIQTTEGQIKSGLSDNCKSGILNKLPPSVNPGESTCTSIPVSLITNIVSSGNNLKSPVSPGRSSSAISTSPNTTCSVVTTPSPRKSFKLIEIYRRLFGYAPPESHRAEDDCITLLKCAQRTKDFITMNDKHAELFSSIKPGY